MLLTVEIKDGTDVIQTEAAVCFDDEGLEYLVDKLLRLRGKKEHTHLMTSSWGGNELSETKQGGAEFELVNHLRLVKL